MHTAGYSIDAAIALIPFVVYGIPCMHLHTFFARFKTRVIQMVIDGYLERIHISAIIMCL